ncbi:transposase [Cupriavidus sp. YAF13]|uniref:transposase n=1 Tax=Cupriavidus sp. YAF13 TaxID=3233075 RepID=UPI003F91CBA1
MSRLQQQRPTRTEVDPTASRASAPVYPHADDQRRATTLIHVRAGGAAGTSDADLTAFLLAAWRKLQSASHRPPQCPRCRARKSTFDGIDGSGLPLFHCAGCRQRFSRLTGTPMARLRLEDKAEAFFNLASQQVSVAEAARRLGIKSETVRHWSIQARLWLLKLDRQGDWERRVQLGVRYAVLPASTRGEPASAARECKCKCTIASDDSDALAEMESAPLLIRVCPLCEQMAH